MARIHTVTECDDEELARRIRPRDDVLVLEAESAHHELDDATRVSFEGTEGPFRQYRRELVVRPADDPRRHVVEQTVEFRPAIPYWSPLFIPLLKRVLRKGPAPGTTPWWATPDRLTPRHATVVSAMAVFNVVAGVFYGLLTQVLTFASADIGDGTRTEQTDLLAVARLGVVVTMAAMIVADRLGRRRVALMSLTTAGVLTVITALSPTLWAIGALQLVSRNLAVAG